MSRHTTMLYKVTDPDDTEVQTPFLYELGVEHVIFIEWLPPSGPWRKLGTIRQMKLSAAHSSRPKVTVWPGSSCREMLLLDTGIRNSAERYPLMHKYMLDRRRAFEHILASERMVTMKLASTCRRLRQELALDACVVALATLRTQ